ncbi:MAG: hypothetical protein M1832_000935 [Thelocarpon impressellum]|nr:MAG: hypothetical protein M1832_000935 [Thelocarpon impressellum]
MLAPRTIGLPAPSHVDVYSPPLLLGEVGLIPGNLTNLDDTVDPADFNVTSTVEGASVADSDIDKRAPWVNSPPTKVVYVDLLLPGMDSPRRFRLSFIRKSEAQMIHWGDYIIAFAQQTMLTTLLNSFANIGKENLWGGLVSPERICTGAYGWEVYGRPTTRNPIPWLAIREMAGWVLHSADSFRGWHRFHVEVAMSDETLIIFRSLGRVNIRQDQNRLRGELRAAPIVGGQFPVSHDWAAAMLNVGPAAEVGLTLEELGLSDSDPGPSGSGSEGAGTQGSSWTSDVQMDASGGSQAGASGSSYDSSGSAAGSSGSQPGSATMLSDVSPGMYALIMQLLWAKHLGGKDGEL